MKRIWLFFMTILIFCSLAGCDSVSSRTAPSVPIQTYKDIPGITGEEIAAIEAVKAGRDRFSYGSIISTEAFMLPDGSRAGFSQKICALLSELFEIPFELKLYEWDDLMGSLESGSLDFTGELTPTEERLTAYSMTVPIAERSLRIFTHTDINNLNSRYGIDGRSIGFLTGSVTAASIKKYYPMTFTCVDVDNYPMAAQMIGSGEIDAFVCDGVVDPAFEEYPFIQSMIFFPMVYECVSISTANPELAPIISAANKYIAAGGRDRLSELYKAGDLEYVRYRLNGSLTREERAYIDDMLARGASVGVAYEDDNYPVCFYNENNGRYEGIALDVLAEISLLTDLQFEAAAAKGTAWPEMYERILTGEIAMAAQILRSDAREDQFIWGATPYSHSYYAFLSQSDYPDLERYQVTEVSVGVLKKSGHADTYRELFADSSNLVEYETMAECLDALENGEVDLLMGSEHMLLTLTNYREKSGFKINIKLDAPMDSYYGYHKDERILCAVIDKAQQYVETEKIEIRWTSRVFDYAKKLVEERSRYLTVFVVILLLILAATVFLFGRNIRLGKKLQEIANTDALTGILNRRCFMELSTIQIARSLRMKTECFIMIYDLDHFKAVNDRYGHLAGDNVLKEAAQRVKKIIRPYDLFGRYGGEEFILLILDANKETAIAIAERIRQELCKTPVDFEGESIQISASFGIAHAAAVNDMDTPTRHADEALYRAKEGGRNRVVYYE